MHTHPHAEQPTGSPQHHVAPGEERWEECTCNDGSCSLCLRIASLCEDAGEEEEAEEATVEDEDERTGDPEQDEESTIQDGKLGNDVERNVKP
jgi:hypothetical protein